MKNFFEIVWMMLSILWTPVDPDGRCIEAMDFSNRNKDYSGTDPGPK